MTMYEYRKAMQESDHAVILAGEFVFALLRVTGSM